jgi:hypothetical protein
VPGLRRAAIRNFAFHQNVGKIFRQQVANARSQLADTQRSPLRHQIKRELAHMVGADSPQRKAYIMRLKNIFYSRPVEIFQRCRQSYLP